MRKNLAVSIAALGALLAVDCLAVAGETQGEIFDKTKTMLEAAGVSCTLMEARRQLPDNSAGSGRHGGRMGGGGMGGSGGAGSEGASVPAPNEKQAGDRE
jgi:uncharacterized membrane protein YgcG